jgi:uncharacterized protein
VANDVPSVGWHQQTDLLVIQPTPFCNINCSYCYLPHREDKKRLSIEVAERIFERFLAFPTVRGSVTIVWHAGEPMVLPPRYYQEMFELIERLAKPRSVSINHSFQTNATLVTDDWCDLIKKWRLKVGVSIDGPQDLHDRHRRYRDGSGSFAKAYAGLQKLIAHQIPVHMISVLTLTSLAQPERMYDFYEKSGVHTVCFNIEEKEGMNATSELAENPEQFVELYRAFLQRFFGLAVERGGRINVREFDAAFRNIAAYIKKGDYVNYQTEPLGIVAVDTEGNLSTFSPELLGVEHPTYGSFGFGNILTDDYETLLGRIKESRLLADINAGVEKCRKECKYFLVCGGGAPANKIFENNTAASTETVFCRALQTDVDVVLDMIERIPASALKNLQLRSSDAVRRF